MTVFTNLKSGLQSLFLKQQIDRELNEELQSYLEASAADKQRSGMSPEAAQRAARAEMGSRNSVKHQVWSSRWESTADNLVQDIHLSFRLLAKSPGFTFVAVASLALGIGANTAIFTLINQVLLRSLPVSHPEQLVTFTVSSSSGVAGGIDLGDFGLFPWYFARQLQSNPGPFQQIAAYGSFSDKISIRIPQTAGLESGLTSRTPAISAPAILAPANLVSGNYFSTIGAQPLIGRTITPADDATPGSGPVVVLSHHFWQRSLSADSSVLGKTILVNGYPFAIVGVMPPSFHGIKAEMEPTDLWAPISMQSQILRQPSFLTPSGPYFLHLFGRLSAQAAANESAFTQSQNWLDMQIRAGIRANEGTAISPARLQEINNKSVPLIPAAQGVSSIRSRFGDSLKILMAVVALVLLIACANLANFLLARTAGRQREIATRLALGSSRGRIVRQSLIESLMLSIAGGAIGLGIAFSATRALIAFFSNGLSYTILNPSPDVSVLLFTLGVSLCTAFLFGLVPALSTARTGAATSLASNARMTTSGGSARFFPKALVTAQVVLSLLLLIAAGLFLRTLQNIQNQNFGFERSHLLLAEFNPKLVGYKPSQVPALHQSLIERLSAIPGVRSVALSLTPPISGGNWTSTIKPQGYTPAPKENMVSLLNRVSSQYFETTGIEIIAGRPINSADTLTSLKVAVVNEALANRYYPRGDAIGHSITIDTDSIKGPWRIVGIARDTKSGNPASTEASRMTYLPLAQMEPLEPADPSQPVPPGSTASATRQATQESQNRFVSTILIRTTGDPTNTIADLRRAVARVDPNLPILQIHTIDEIVNSFMTQLILVSRLCSLFSALALLLSAIGLYGVMSYAVVRRTSEIGIRFALGAQTKTVLWMVLRESLLLLLIGLVLGLPLSFAATRILRNQLFGVSTFDPFTFVSAIVIVATMTLFAAWLPARRAASVDPMAALRCD
jgi:predicted permease